MANTDNKFWTTFFVTAADAPPPAVAPNPPTSLSGTSGDGSIQLTWAVSNSTNVVSTGIYQNGTFIQEVAHPANTLEIRGLTNGVAVNIQVDALADNGLRSALSPAVSFTPVAAPAPVPDPGGGGTVPGPANFDSWTHKMIPPNNDWAAHASYLGNPNFDKTKLTTQMRLFYDKSYFYFVRLLLDINETVALPQGGTAGYIQSGITYKYKYAKETYAGSVGGNKKSYKKGLIEGGGTKPEHGIQNVRDWSRNCMDQMNTALHLFMLTHDTNFLDFALFFFERYWTAALYYTKGKEVWRSGVFVGVVTNQGGDGYGTADWENDNWDTKDTTMHLNPSNWSAVYFRGFSILAGGRQSPSNSFGSNATKHSRFGIPNSDDMVRKAGASEGNSWGSDQPLEDGLLFNAFARLVRALLPNRNLTSRAGYSYKDWHDRCHWFMISEITAKWKAKAKNNYSKFNGHPLFYKTLTHAHTQTAAMYYNLYKYCLEHGGLASQANDYYKAFMYLVEPLASDVLFVDLSEKYGESIPLAIWPHRVGQGGYHRNWDGTGSPTWESINGFESVKPLRKGVGVPKFIYCSQTYDATLDLYLSKYWNDVPSADKNIIRCRNGRNDATKNHFLYSKRWHESFFSMLTYSMSENPTDGSVNKVFSSGITGQNNWFRTNPDSHLSLGGGSGNTKNTNVNTVLDSPLGYSVMFDGALTGVGKGKVRSAIDARRAADGNNWAPGKIAGLVKCNLEFLDGLLNKKN